MISQKCCNIVCICSSSLALSLPIPIMISNLRNLSDGSNVYLVNRKKHSNHKNYTAFQILKNQKRYTLKYSDEIVKSVQNVDIHFKPTKKEEISDFNVIEIDIGEDVSIHADFCDSIKQGHLFVLLSPNGDNARAYALKKLKEILVKANREKYVFIASCENGYKVSTSLYQSDPELTELKKEFKNLHFLNCIVDRVTLNEWEVSKDPMQEEVTIYTESYKKWIIEHSNTYSTGESSCEAKKMLDIFFPKESQKTLGVSFIDSGTYDIEFYKKTICINGLHYAIALLQEYSYISSSESTSSDYKHLNCALYPENCLFCLVKKIIEELKESCFKMQKYYYTTMNLEAPSNETIRKDIDLFVESFLRRMMLSNDTRNRILDPLCRLSCDSSEIWKRISELQNTYLSTCDLYSIEELDRDKLIEDFVSFVKTDILLPFDKFLNLHDFEEKFLDRIMTPINFHRFGHPHYPHLEQNINPTSNLELERIAILTSYIIKSECSKLRDITHEYLR